MRKLLAYALCTAGMIGVFLLVQYVFANTSLAFGEGLAVGAGIMALLFWGAERVGGAR